MRRQKEKGDELGGQGGRAEMPIWFGCVRGSVCGGCAKRVRETGLGRNMLGPEGDQVPDRDASQGRAIAPLDDGAEELPSLGETDRVELARRVLDGVDESREGGELGADGRDLVVCVAEKGRASVDTYDVNFTAVYG